MKKIITIGFLGLLLAFSSANAQTEKGNLLLGGSLANLRIGVVDAGGSSFNITPSAGYFIADGVVVGASLPIGYNRSSYNDSWGKYVSTGTSFGIGAYTRYYFKTGNPLSFFGRLGLGVNTYTSKEKYTSTSDFTEDDSFKSSGSDFYSTLGFGAVYFLNDNIGVEGVLSTSDITEDFLSLNFGIGFQIYFNPNN